jgi:hypothetical protein
MALLQRKIEHTIPIRMPAYQTALISHDECKQLDKLTGQALFDKSLERRLVVLRDDTLPAIYQLSANTWDHLKQIKAEDLQEFCEKVGELQKIMVSH